MVDSKTQAALANRWCGVIKALQHEAADLGECIPECLWLSPMKAEIAEMAETVRELWPDRFSASYLEERVKRLVSEVAAQPIRQATKDCFVAFLAELDAFAERKLCIAPVEGVRLVSDDPVTIGPFVLRRVVPGQRNRIHKLTTEMLSHTLHTPEEQVGIAAALRKQTEELLTDNDTILELELTADAKQAHALFFKKASMLMDLLQLATTVAEFCGSARIGLRGYPHGGSYSGWVLPLNLGGGFQPNRRTGGIGDICLSDGNLYLMRRAGVMRLAEALGREATPLESALLRAVYWFAQATLQDDEGHGILCLVVCLEAILPSHSSSGRAVAESVALVVGKTPQQRRRLYKLVLGAYAVRNRVAHEGILGDGFSDAKEFRQAVLDFLSSGIWLCDSLRTPQCLIQHVGELRFS